MGFNGTTHQKYINSIATKNMIEMTAINPNFAGIYAPENWDGGTGITNQFIARAGDYHKKYFNVPYVAYMIRTALDGLDIPLPKSILDVGSGSGPSVIALLERYPEAHVVATDTSPQLLSILRQELLDRGLSERCTILCVDLNVFEFVPYSFDLALGSAILHHLFEPDVFLKRLFPSVKMAGALAFFEPFEPAYKINGLLYRLLLAENKEHNDLPQQLMTLLKSKINEYGINTKCEPKDYASYKDIDDKWAFTSNYFEEIGHELGAKRTIFKALNQSPSPLYNQLSTEIRICLNKNIENLLPEWARNIISEVEAGMSVSCKNDFAFSKTVTFLK
jgi:ubiquinone/menaquinone biosynthesis C-methylase UbiE